MLTEWRVNRRISDRRCRIISLLGMAALVLLSACEGMGSIHDSPDFYRHSYSQLSTPISGEGGYYWFDVKLTPEFPIPASILKSSKFSFIN